MSLIRPLMLESSKIWRGKKNTMHEIPIVQPYDPKVVRTYRKFSLELDPSISFSKITTIQRGPK